MRPVKPVTASLPHRLTRYSRLRRERCSQLPDKFARKHQVLSVMQKRYRGVHQSWATAQSLPPRLLTNSKTGTDPEFRVRSWAMLGKSGNQDGVIREVSVPLTEEMRNGDRRVNVFSSSGF